VLILGIESATAIASVAVATEYKILAEHMVNNLRTHSVNLMPMIKDTLADAGVSKEQLTGIAVASGPGSFTGLRIGISTARALAQVLKLPLIGVSTLEALAYALSSQQDALVCPLLNARKNEIYTALYRTDRNAYQCLIPAQAINIEGLLALLAEYREQITFLGDGLPEYGEHIKSVLGFYFRLAPLCASFPRGAAIAEIGIKMLYSGAVFDPLALLPNYARESEAELKWQERNFLNGQTK